MSGGQARAAKLLAEKIKAVDAYYVGVPLPQITRQMRRSANRQLAKYERGKRKTAAAMKNGGMATVR